MLYQEVPVSVFLCMAYVQQMSKASEINPQLVL
jgi:hypothetical protein